MNPWCAKAVVLAAFVVMNVIRAPHGQRSRQVPVALSRRGPMEIVMLTLVWLSYPVPIVWIASPWLKFAEYRLLPLPLAVGTICLGVGLWLFFRSHSDLGRNWSVTLEVRKNHELITRGVYRRLRHPMYASLLLYSVGQALVIPNWIAGPSYLIVLVPIIGLRFTPEERMMLDQFGDAYRSYAARTKRLIPGIW